MPHLPVMTLVLCLLGIYAASAALQFDDESKLQEREAAREIVVWLLGLPRRPDPPLCTHKRNSELINSLLGLPKVLNDAGRK